MTSQLPVELEELYARELTPQSTKPFKEEFVRTTMAERRILDEHGYSGAAFLLQRATKATIGWADGCPWQAPSGSVSADALAALGTLRFMLPSFVAGLLERLRYVIPLRRASGWQLAYLIDRALYDGRPYYETFFGGPPNPNPVLASGPAEIGWCVPKSLRAFYLVHDGLGPSNGGIVQCGKLTDLSQMMDPIAAEKHFRPDGYEFRDLLEFCPDGAGNAQCFLRHDDGDEDPQTVDWDHETWEISGEEGFASFADRRLSEFVGDEE